MGTSRPATSARREFARLHADYEAHMLRERRFIGSLILRLQPEPQPTRVWEQGASSERIVGARLDRIDGIEVLHDRQIPGTRANIDHIAIGPGGVYVIATKFAGVGGHRKHPDARGFLRHDRRLLIDGQDQAKLLGKIGNQVGAIARVLRETPIPVAAGLCVVDAKWPVPLRPFTLHGVWIGWPDALAGLVKQTGFLDSEAMKTAAAILDARLPRS